MGYDDIDNLDHDPKLAEALGHMVVTWAKAETAMLNVMACVLDAHFNTATVAWYRIPTFETRTRVLLGLIGEWQPQKYDKDTLRTAVTKLGKLARTRNHWVHGVWCRHDEKPETVIFDFRAPNGPKRRRPVKSADVQGHIHAVRNWTRELTDQVPIYYYPPSPSPGKSP